MFVLLTSATVFSLFAAPSCPQFSPRPLSSPSLNQLVSGHLPLRFFHSLALPSLVTHTNQPRTLPRSSLTTPPRPPFYLDASLESRQLDAIANCPRLALDGPTPSQSPPVARRAVPFSPTCSRGRSPLAHTTPSAVLPPAESVTDTPRLLWPRPVRCSPSGAVDSPERPDGTRTPFHHAHLGRPANSDSATTLADRRAPTTISNRRPGDDHVCELPTTNCSACHRGGSS